MEAQIKLRDPDELAGTRIDAVDLRSLPVYENTSGIFNFYAPQKSGKTVLASKFCGQIMRKNKDIGAVYCFCPVPRAEWKQLQQLALLLRVPFRFITKDHDIAMMTLLELREADFAKGRKAKILLIWDDMMSVADMHACPWDQISRTMACKARHAEVNMIWVVLSQDPTACVPIIRDNSTMSFFSNCSKRAIEHITDAMSDDIDLTEIRRRAHSFQFICYHHHLKKIYCTKVIK